MLPISNAGATSAGCDDGGSQFAKAGASYAIRFAARSSVPPGHTLQIEVLSGSWIGHLSNYSGRSLGVYPLTSAWTRIATNVTVTDPSTSCFQVRASGSVGQMWVDDFFVGKQ